MLKANQGDKSSSKVSSDEDKRKSEYNNVYLKHRDLLIEKHERERKHLEAQFKTGVTGVPNIGEIEDDKSPSDLVILDGLSPKKSLSTVSKGENSRKSSAVIFKSKITPSGDIKEKVVMLQSKLADLTLDLLLTSDVDSKRELQNTIDVVNKTLASLTSSNLEKFHSHNAMWNEKVLWINLIKLMLLMIPLFGGIMLLKSYKGKGAL